MDFNLSDYLNGGLFDYSTNSLLESFYFDQCLDTLNISVISGNL